MYFNPSACGNRQFHALAVFIQERFLSQSLTGKSLGCRAIVDAVRAGKRAPIPRLSNPLVTTALRHKLKVDVCRR